MPEALLSLGLSQPAPLSSHSRTQTPSSRRSGIPANHALAHLATARGWILNVLEERGELPLVGVCSGCYSDLLDDCSCPDDDCRNASA